MFDGSGRRIERFALVQGKLRPICLSRYRQTNRGTNHAVIRDSGHAACGTFAGVWISSAHAGVADCVECAVRLRDAVPAT